VIGGTPASIATARPEKSFNNFFEVDFRSRALRNLHDSDCAASDRVGNQVFLQVVKLDPLEKRKNRRQTFGGRTLSASFGAT